MYVPVLDDGLIWGKALDRGSGNMLPDPCLQTKQSVFLRPNLTFHEIGALSTMTASGHLKNNVLIPRHFCETLIGQNAHKRLSKW